MERTKEAMGKKKKLKWSKKENERCVGVTK